MSIAELSQITVFADGSTDPFVPPGIEILLVQNGEVEVGRLYYTPNSFDTYIEHPKNNSELSRRAIELLKKKKPEILETQDAKLLLCPDEIKSRMIW